MLGHCPSAGRWRGVTDDAADKFTKLFNKGHYIIFNLTVGVLQNNNTTAHLLGWDQPKNRLYGGLANTLRILILPMLLILDQRGKVILWPKATNILHLKSFDFLSSLFT